MNLKHVTFIVGLSSIATGPACDPGSKSLGDEPTGGSEGESGESGEGSIPTADSESLGVLEGGSIQHLDVREDGSVVAAGVSGYQGTFGDLTLYDAMWVGAFAEDGGLQWERSLPFSQNELGELEERDLTGLDTGPDGSVFISLVDYSDIPVSDNAVSKFSADGEPLWTTTLPSRPRSVAATGNGGAVAVGLELAEDNPNAVYGWAVHLDSLGAIVATRTWTNSEGRGTLFDSVLVSEQHGFLLGGSWGTSPESSQAEAWLVWVDDDLQTLAELRLPASGGTDGINDLRLGEDGNALAVVDIDDRAVVTVSADASILSTVLVDPELVFGSAYSPTGYVGSERSNCAESFDPATDCGVAAYVNIEDEEQQWTHTTPGCNAGVSHAFDAQGALVVLHCNTQGDDGLELRSELHRLESP
ncbi:MAG: hypothetical protein ACRBN8_12425 [Nannocystales bacterium]